MNIQFKKGVLELCVLTLLKKKDRYGYELANTLAKNVNFSEGTVYPILRRLKKNGYLTTYIQESDDGPARKYYKLTTEGKSAQKEMLNEWNEFTKQINLIIKKANEKG